MRKTLLLALLLSAGPILYGDDIPAAQASSHAGETATVCGDVTGIHTAARSKGKPTLAKELDIDESFLNRLAEEVRKDLG